MTKKKQTVETEEIKDDETVVEEGATDCKTVETDNVTEENEQECDKESPLSEGEGVFRDKYLRLSAEFDNYRKRTLKEKMDLIESGGSDVLKSILSILDDFDRAQKATAATEDVEVVKEGTKLIHQKLIDTLKQRGVTEIEAIGKEFDTDFCEAIVKVPAPDETLKGKVVDVVEKGYYYKDKVLRFAKVVVGE